jgi:predicted Fe-Mo cluster-binding NifX family protein
MLAVAIKTEKVNSAVSPLFGKAKFFAFYDGHDVRIEKNDKKGGVAVVNWLAEQGVDTLIIKEMGSSPYAEVKKRGMILLYAGDERIEINDIITKYENGLLETLSAEKVEQIIAKHEKNHTHKH